MRREASVVSVVLLATFVAGCRFNKATDKQINPPPDPDDMPDAGPDLQSIDVIIMPPPDAQLFEAEASQNCIEANPVTMNLPPDVLIVLDRSGSMNDKIDGTSCNNQCRTMGMSKWVQMTSTLTSFIPTVETTVNWGLKLFATDDGSSTGCTVTSGVEVAPKTANASAISAAIAPPLMAGSSTPTAAAETAAMTYLLGLNDGNPKFILLATDGIPTCGTATCAAGVIPTGNQNQCDDANAIAAVKTAFDMGIPTFVIGVGTATGGGDATLTEMAKQGGFPRMGAAQAYYSVESATELQAAFGTITQTVGSCFFSVRPVPKSADEITAVRGDGNVIPQGGSDGWTFVTGANAGVMLNGKSCDDYKSGKVKSVIVDLPCIVP